MSIPNNGLYIIYDATLVTVLTDDKRKGSLIESLCHVSKKTILNTILQEV